jgi:hypothetical protein
MVNWSYYFNYANGKLFWGVKPSNGVAEGDEAGHLTAKGYRCVHFKGKHYKIHRIIYEMHHGEIPEDMVIDHINGDKADNRIENLQCVTDRYNLHRNSRGSVIKYRRKYKATRNQEYLGLFGTLCGAQMACNTYFI